MTFHETLTGGYQPELTLLGNPKMSLDLFGNPKIAIDAMGNQIVDWICSAIRGFRLPTEPSVTWPGTARARRLLAGEQGSCWLYPR